MRVLWGSSRTSTCRAISINGWVVYSTLVRAGSLIKNGVESAQTDSGSGYLAWEYPTNRLLQRLPLGKYSAICIIIWGLILSCFAAVHNYLGAIFIRLGLGVFESAVTPGFALLTSQVSLSSLRRHIKDPSGLI